MDTDGSYDEETERPHTKPVVAHMSDDDVVSEEILGEIETGLESCAGFVRRNLAGTLELRRMPELRFRYDPSLQLGGETLELLQAIHDGKEKKSQ